MKFTKEYIGQSEFCRTAENICNAVAEERNIPLPCLGFTGYAGLGKTNAAENLAKWLKQASEGQTNALGERDEFAYVEINAATTLPNLINMLVEIEHKRVLIFVDEAHALSKKVLNFLKPILEIGNAMTKEIRHGDFRFTVDRKRHLWIFASNENLLDSAIFGSTGRATSLQFVPYSRAEVIALIKFKAAFWAKEFKITPEAVEYLAERVLPNGRAIDHLVKDECMYSGPTITVEKAKEMCKTYKRFPGGLCVNDIKTLKFLGIEASGKQVNEISSHCGGEPSKETSYRLQWLAGLGYVDTKAGKKRLTPSGAKYLADLEAKQKAKKAATR